jgi:hypothetical protein
VGKQSLQELRNEAMRERREQMREKFEQERERAKLILISRKERSPSDSVPQVVKKKRS